MNRLHRAFDQIIMRRVKGFGKVPICNLNACRAPKIGPFCFPLCWRCTAIILPFLLLSPFVVISNDAMWIKILAVFLILPTSIDGVMQYGFKKESTNARRIMTGMLCGIGLVLLAQ